MPFNYYNEICKHLKNGSEYLLFLGNGWNNVRTEYKNLISLLVRDGKLCSLQWKVLHWATLLSGATGPKLSPQFLQPVWPQVPTGSPLPQRASKSLATWTQSASSLAGLCFKTDMVTLQLRKNRKTLELHADLHQAEQHASDERKSQWQGDRGLNSDTPSASVTTGTHARSRLSLSSFMNVRCIAPHS